MPDFPEPGIQFKDLTPLLADARGLDAVTDALADIAEGADLVAGVDARGFLLGGAVAIKLGIGVLAVRKGGKLPPPVFSETYELEYGTATLEVPGRWHRSWPVATSSSSTTCWPPAAPLAATAKLLRHAGANVTGAAVVLELPALGRPRRAQTATGQQLAHGVRRYPRSLAKLQGDERSREEQTSEVTMADDPGTGQAVQAPPGGADPRDAAAGDPQDVDERVAAGARPAGPPDDRPAQRRQPGAGAAGRRAPGALSRRPTWRCCSRRTRWPTQRHADQMRQLRRPVHHPPAGRRQHPGRARHGHHHAGRRAAARHRRGHRLHAGRR